jgi:hypothetical protein
MKVPGIHCYVAGSIPAVTPRYCTKKIGKSSLEHKKKTEEKKYFHNVWYLIHRLPLKYINIPTLVTITRLPLVQYFSKTFYLSSDNIASFTREGFGSSFSKDVN